MALARYRGTFREDVHPRFACPYLPRRRRPLRHRTMAFAPPAQRSSPAPAMKPGAPRADPRHAKPAIRHRARKPSHDRPIGTTTRDGAPSESHWRRTPPHDSRARHRGRQRFFRNDRLEEHYGAARRWDPPRRRAMRRPRPEYAPLQTPQLPRDARARGTRRRRAVSKTGRPGAVPANRLRQCLRRSASAITMPAIVRPTMETFLPLIAPGKRTSRAVPQHAVASFAQLDSQG